MSSPIFLYSYNYFISYGFVDVPVAPSLLVTNTSDVSLTTGNNCLLFVGDAKPNDPSVKTYHIFVPLLFNVHVVLDCPNKSLTDNPK